MNKILRRFVAFLLVICVAAERIMATHPAGLGAAAHRVFPAGQAPLFIFAREALSLPETFADNARQGSAFAARRQGGRLPLPSLPPTDDGMAVMAKVKQAMSRRDYLGALTM